MCGIFGYVGHLNGPKALTCLQRLVHRGPDGYGLWVQPDVVLGHRRLAILDLSDNGKQPMTEASGRFHITFNGEIYNFVELRAELIGLGHIFRSDSDTEVILAAFRQWREGCLHRFNGMWAFAIWDAQEKSLFIARDRLGKKPLFYISLPNGDFAFASEMKALFPLMESVRANTAVVGNSAQMFRYEGSQQCVIEDVQRFPAGHTGWFRHGETLKMRRWWCTLDHLVQVPVRYEEQVEQFRELFMDACRLRMRSDVPIGTALSGGLDSSATISCMAQLGKQGRDARMGKDWQHAFVASFPGTPLDEVAYAQQVVDHIDIPATIVPIDPLAAMDKLDSYFYLFEDIYITSPIPFMLTYAAVKQHGISVTLDGHGADELFGGYSFDYREALHDARGNLRQAYTIADTCLSSLPQSTDQFSRSRSKTAFIADFHLRHAAKRLLGRDTSVVSRDQEHPAWQSLGRLNQQLYVSTHETILPTLLRNYDRYSMANSVEIRMPFLDHRLLSFAFSIPWHSKIRNGYSKAIIRDAVSPYMPAQVAYRKTKIGFNSPVLDWMKGPLRHFMQDILHSQSFKECDLIDVSAVERTILHVLGSEKATFADAELAWTSLTPYLWEQSVLKRASAK